MIFTSQFYYDGYIMLHGKRGFVDTIKIMNQLTLK